MSETNENTETTAPVEQPETTPTKRQGGARRPRRETTSTENVEVIARGKGRRDAHEAITVETVTAGPVTVEEDMDFAAAMEGEDTSKVETGFARGKRVKATVEVISATGPEIFLDLGDKSTGYILKSDVATDAEGNVALKPGDVIDVVVVDVDDNGVRVRTNIGGGDVDLSSVRAAFESKTPVEGKIVGVNKGGYEIRIDKVRAFCPHSQIDVIRVENPETLIGQVTTFRVTEIKEKGVVVSRAAILREERSARGAELMTKIGVGMKLTGRVRSIQKFGAFVDLGGKDGLVHVSELSWTRVEDPATLLKVGQEVEVVVTEVDTAKDKIGLSIKRAQPDPIEDVGAQISVGEVVTGKVVRLKDFGAFIELAPNVEGLIHISDLAHYRVRHPKDILKVGETVSVKVIDIQLDRRQIKLSLKALLNDPWEGIEERYPVGKVVTAKVDSIQDFGVFVSLEQGVNALLPASESKTEGQPLTVAFKVGKELEARILRVDVAEKRIALTRRDEDEVRARPAREGGASRGPRGERQERQSNNDGDWQPRGNRRGGTLAYSDSAESGEQPLSAFAAALMKAGLKKGK